MFALLSSEWLPADFSRSITIIIHPPPSRLLTFVVHALLSTPPSFPLFFSSQLHLPFPLFSVYSFIFIPPFFLRVTLIFFCFSSLSFAFFHIVHLSCLAKPNLPFLLPFLTILSFYLFIFTRVTFPLYLFLYHPILSFSLPSLPTCSSPSLPHSYLSLLLFTFFFSSYFCLITYYLKMLHVPVLSFPPWLPFL